MSFKLEKPYTAIERADFIVKYNHNLGMNIGETDEVLYALDADEIIQDNKLIKNPNYESEYMLKQQELFEAQFFQIETVGYFRKRPKGYSSAVEAMGAAFNIVYVLGYLPENILTFYKVPDFSDETQCTEDWLVANSYKNEKLTQEEFGQLYAKFLKGWNDIEHKDI